MGTRGVQIDPATGFVACMRLDTDPDISVLLMSFADPEDPSTARPVGAGETGEVWLCSGSCAAGCVALGGVGCSGGLGPAFGSQRG